MTPIVWSRSCVARQRTIPRHRRSRLSWVLGWPICLEIPQLEIVRRRRSSLILIPLAIVRGRCLAELIQPLLCPRPTPGGPSVSRAPIPALSTSAVGRCVGILGPLAILHGGYAAAATTAVEYRGYEDANDQADEWEDGVCEWLVGQRPRRVVIGHGRSRLTTDKVCQRLVTMFVV